MNLPLTFYPARPRFLPALHLDLFSFLRSLAVSASLGTTLLGSVVLTGWILDNAALRSIIPDTTPMNATTAASLLAAGLALCLLQTLPAESRVRGIARLGSAVAVVAGVLTLLDYVFEEIDPFSQLFSHSSSTLQAALSTPMPFTTALAVILIGVALLVMQGHAAQKERLSQYIAFAASVIPALTLLGYTDGILDTVGVSNGILSTSQTILPYKPMPWSSAVGLLLACLGILFAQPRSGLMRILFEEKAGGVAARRLLWTALVIPFAVELVAMQGERAGWYDSTLEAWLHSLFTIAALVLIVLTTMQQLNRVDEARRRSEQVWQTSEAKHLLIERTRAEGALTRTVGALRESEERFRKVVELAPDAIFIHVDGSIVFANAAAASLLGAADSQALEGKPIMHFVHPDYHSLAGQRMRPTYAEDVPAPLFEQKFMRVDGSLVDVEMAAIPFTYENRPAVQIVARNITLRKKAEADLKTLSRRLLEAQESERRMIARELHDAIGQIFTAVKSNLQAIQLSPDPDTIASGLDESISIVNSALRQVRDLSFDLRPSLLDDFGLVPAVDWYLERQAQRNGWSIKLDADPKEMDLPPALATACFRTVQAALTNVARHAHAKQVQVELKLEPFRETLFGQETRVHISICDDGIGFDVSRAMEQARRGQSLGLLAMEERVQLAGGQLEIVSAPGQGTRARACFRLVRPRVERRARQREIA